MVNSQDVIGSITFGSELGCQKKFWIQILRATFYVGSRESQILRNGCAKDISLPQILLHLRSVCKSKNNFYNCLLK